MKINMRIILNVDVNRMIIIIKKKEENIQLNGQIDMINEEMMNMIIDINIIEILQVQIIIQNIRKMRHQMSNQY
jgi:hypothetical protein